MRQHCLAYLFFYYICYIKLIIMTNPATILLEFLAPFGGHDMNILVTAITTDLLFLNVRKQNQAARPMAPEIIQTLNLYSLIRAGP
jgi:hypothetical protein